MKTTTLFQKFTLSTLMTGSLLVFAGVYQTLKLNDTSYMSDREVKFEKRFDEGKERVVASKVKTQKAIHYVPVNEYNSAVIDGKWEIVRIEDENGDTVIDSTNGDKSKIVNFELVATSQVRINQNEKYLFDISFLHPENKNIALFRAYGNGYELIEARKIENSKNSGLNGLLGNNDKNETETFTTPSEGSVELTLERAMIPSLENTVLIGEKFVSGEVSIGEGFVQGLNFTVVNKAGKEVSYSIEDIQIQDGGSFQVEVDGQESAGIISNNGKDSYRIRFATGPLQGSLLNFVSDTELQRMKDEAYEVELLKEERSSEESIQVTEVVENQENVAESRKVSQNVVDASFKPANINKEELKKEIRAELQDEMREEIQNDLEEEIREEVTEELKEEGQIEYTTAGITGTENMVAEVSRQGFSF